ncbi:MAG: ribonuclease III [Bacteroidota bacterium]
MFLKFGRFVFIPFSRNRRLARKLSPILGFFPGRIKLYELAFIHKSASIVMQNGDVINNERLEYLGDAILDAIVADYLFKTFPDKNEGFLTKMRSKMVKRKHLNLLAYRIGLNQLVVSHTNPVNVSKHLYGNAFEALIGAIYLDKGFQRTCRFVERIIDRFVDIEKLKLSESDYKSKLIEWAQKNKVEVVFDSHEELTGAHKTPQFISYIKMLNKELGKGVGHSKKDAEQKAAKNALENILNH